MTSATVRWGAVIALGLLVAGSPLILPVRIGGVLLALAAMAALWASGSFLIRAAGRWRGVDVGGRFPLFGASPFAALVVVGALVLAAGVSAGVTAAIETDTQCTEAHVPSSEPPARLATAADYLALGDSEFDRGDCAGAIAAYTRAIEIEPEYAAAYNNGAYTRMRLGDYAGALPDLDRSIELRPDYIHALMNRGDLYNFYLPGDHQRAVADYDHVILLGGTHGTSVCGHRLLALHGGWSLGTGLALLRGGITAGC